MIFWHLHTFPEVSSTIFLNNILNIPHVQLLIWERSVWTTNLFQFRENIIVSISGIRQQLKVFGNHELWTLTIANCVPKPQAH